MPRALRNYVVVPDGIYHVIVRGNNKMRVFHDADDYDAYLKYLLNAAKDHRVTIYHYVLMPNHVHILAKPTSDLSSFMHAVQMPFAKRYCKKYKFVGHVWQGRFKSLIVATDPYLFACGNYIEMNPVRAKLVASPEKWHYSSYGVYAFGETDPLVTVDPFYETLGATDLERQSAYQRLVSTTRFSPDP
ncbi:MAG: transposase [Patescibacteria group bacterium]|nr:MAG: transposase [Patescibacteria group bacterium]